MSDTPTLDFLRKKFKRSNGSRNLTNYSKVIKGKDKDVMVRDMTLGKEYRSKDNVILGKLISMTMSGSGGTQNTEPTFTLVFENKTLNSQDWDNKFIEVTYGGRRRRLKSEKVVNLDASFREKSLCNKYK